MALLSWRVLDLAFYRSLLLEIWSQSLFPETKSLTTFLVLATYLCQTALPFAYLYVVQYRNLCTACSKEVPTLQADIQDVLQASTTLQKQLAMPNSGRNKASASGCPASTGLSTQPDASHKELASATAKPTQQADAGAPEDECGITTHIAQDMHEACDSSMTVKEAACQPHQARQSLKEGTGPKMASDGCQDGSTFKQGKGLQLDDSSASTKPGSALLETAEHWVGKEAEAAEQDSESFRARMTAAVESSSRIIAILTARLEAMVYYRSGVRIQGHAECSAAWAM